MSSAINIVDVDGVTDNDRHWGKRDRLQIASPDHSRSSTMTDFSDGSDLKPYFNEETSKRAEIENESRGTTPLQSALSSPISQSLVVRNISNTSSEGSLEPMDMSSADNTPVSQNRRQPREPVEIISKTRKFQKKDVASSPPFQFSVSGLVKTTKQQGQLEPEHELLEVEQPKSEQPDRSEQMEKQPEQMRGQTGHTEQVDLAEQAQRTQAGPEPAQQPDEHSSLFLVPQAQPPSLSLSLSPLSIPTEPTAADKPPVLIRARSADSRPSSSSLPLAPTNPLPFLHPQSTDVNNQPQAQPQERQISEHPEAARSPVLAPAFTTPTAVVVSKGGIFRTLGNMVRSAFNSNDKDKGRRRELQSSMPPPPPRVPVVSSSSPSYEPMKIVISTDDQEEGLAAVGPSRIRNFSAPPAPILSMSTSTTTTTGIGIGVGVWGDHSAPVSAVKAANTTTTKRRFGTLFSKFMSSTPEAPALTEEQKSILANANSNSNAITNARVDRYAARVTAPDPLPPKNLLRPPPFHKPLRVNIPSTEPVVSKLLNSSIMRVPKEEFENECKFGPPLGGGAMGLVSRGTFREQAVAVKYDKTPSTNYSQLCMHSEAEILASIRLEGVVGLVGVVTSPYIAPPSRPTSASSVASSSPEGENEFKIPSVASKNNVSRSASPRSGDTPRSDAILFPLAPALGPRPDAPFVINALILQRLEGVRVSERLSPKYHPQLTLEQRLNGLLQIAKTFKALHNNEDGAIVHRDYKPDNMIWTRDDKVVLIDFGLARIQNGSGVLDTKRHGGTDPYTPPEYSYQRFLHAFFRVASDDQPMAPADAAAAVAVASRSPSLGRPTYKVDVYAFGVSLPHFFTGEVWYPNSNSNFPRFPPKYESVYDDIFNLTKACIHGNPDKRCDFEHVVIKLRGIIKRSKNFFTKKKKKVTSENEDVNKKQNKKPTTKK